MVGAVLGHYRIFHALGKGRMGEVYLAEDSKLDRQVAIKVLSASLRSDESRLERFRQTQTSQHCHDSCPRGNR